MTSFKDDLDEDVNELHEFLTEELDMKTMFEQKILLQHYWQSVQRGRKKQLENKRQQETDLNLDGDTGYIG